MDNNINTYLKQLSISNYVKFLFGGIETKTNFVDGGGWRDFVQGDFFVESNSP